MTQQSHNNRCTGKGRATKSTSQSTATHLSQPHFTITPTVTQAHPSAHAHTRPPSATDTNHLPLRCLNRRPGIKVTTGRPYYWLPRFKDFVPHPWLAWSRAQPVGTPRLLRPGRSSTHLAQLENRAKWEKPKIRRDRCPLGNVVRACMSVAAMA